MGMPNAGAYNDIGPRSGSGHLTIRACTQVTPGEVCTFRVLRRDEISFRPRTYCTRTSVDEQLQLSPARRPLQKSSKPTSTDGTGGQPPPMAQSPLNRVCKNFQNGDASLSRRGAGIIRQVTSVARASCVPLAKSFIIPDRPPPFASFSPAIRSTRQVCTTFDATHVFDRLARLDAADTAHRTTSIYHTG